MSTRNASNFPAGTVTDSLPATLSCSELHLLSPDVEVAEGRTIAHCQRQTGNCLIRTGAIGKERPAQIDGYRAVLTVHAHRACCLVAAEVQVNRHRALRKMPLMRSQSGLLNGCGVSRHATRYFHLIGGCPRGAAVLNRRGELEVHHLAACFNFHLIAIEARLQIKGRLGKSGSFFILRSCGSYKKRKAH